MRVIETIIAALMVLILWPAVAAAALIPLLQDLAARRHTHREQQWLTETKDHQS